MNGFLKKIEEDLDNAKKGFNAWMDKVDGTDEFREMQRQQNAEMDKIIDSAPAEYKEQLKKQLSVFANDCFQNGFTQGFQEGSMSASSEME
ncbi:hypothetical protein [Ileibacterium valens]|uniref:Uncharacterized protein n=1 Tax=Ileibacterium valens TaxID=1862668 RepID=A0A1U7NJ79_9FIRM|nr:hypothetical protein [Ileibacterium valens]OLU36430.1 hypothetical protein BO224_12495 [Erysipelotrichaceae bacterium NYU-BL-E8]OLU41432.1 hypothetical protein BM735_04200 [Erysipelotrichaceae bacterium NYU-BL-F16]OLU43093.1 hypothetical protein BO222_00695 [Ileibacterium valens]